MKVLMFNEYTSIRGGTDILFDLESQHLRNFGIDTIKFTFRNSYLNKINYLKKSGILLKSLNGNLVLKALQKKIDGHKPDLIHFHNIYQLFRGPVWAKINTSSKLILHLHNYYPFCLNSFLYKDSLCLKCLNTNSWVPGLRQKCYNKSLLQSSFVATGRSKPSEWIKLTREKISAIIAVSEYQRSVFAAAGIPDDKMIVLQNAIGKKYRQPNQKGSYVLFLGSIRSEKGIWNFIKVVIDNPEIKFVIAGEGPELEMIKKNYSHLKNLKVLGYISGEQKEELFLKARFLFVPSLCPETFGINIIESYSFGVPVLTTGSGGIRELIADGVTGRFSASERHSEDVKRFWCEVNEKWRDYRRNCYEYSQRYLIEKHIKKLVKIYESVLRGEALCTD